MASGSSARLNSGSQGFDFGSDDILCSYDDFNNHDGTTHTADKDFHKSRMTRSSFVPASVYSQPEDSLSQEVISAVERSMKKNTDNLMRFLEGISSRLSQLELYCYNVDKSIGEMRSELVRDHGEVDSKLKLLEKNIGEVQRSLQILRDKQELAETHKELAKLHLAQKESANSNYSQHTEERPSTPDMEPRKVPDSSDALDQKLALALPHQIPQSQLSHLPRTADPSRSVVPPAPVQPQIAPQQQHYYAPPSQIPTQAQPSQDQGQYATADTQYRQSQMQDMSRLPPQPVQPSVNQAPPSQVHQFPQYQQQWPQQPQQQVQSQPLQQPPNLTHIRTQSGPVYPSYQPSQPASPAPLDTIPGNMAVQRPFSAVPQSGKNHADTTIYGYGRRPVQQQLPTQQLKGNNYGAQANDGYTNMGSHPAYTPSNGYMRYGNEEGRPHPQPHPPQPHFSQGGYQQPSAQNSMTRNQSQSQFVRNQPYGDLVEKLVNMGFRGDHAFNVIQMMEDSGQPIDFNSVLDRMSAQSSGSSRGGWSH